MFFPRLSVILGQTLAKVTLHVNCVVHLKTNAYLVYVVHTWCVDIVRQGYEDMDWLPLILYVYRFNRRVVNQLVRYQPDRHNYNVNNLRN